MHRSWLMLAAGVAGGILAFLVAYGVATRESRAILREPGAELIWLKKEFGLSETEFQRVSALHHAYAPTCAQLCRRIAEQNGKLQAAVLATNVVTEEIASLVRETGRVRDDCRAAMLKHLYEVAGQMPPEAGSRYLEVMLAATCILEEPHPMAGGVSSGSGHSHHE